jgi:hypothetical protein
MKKRGRINLRKLYLEILEYNLDSLEKFKKSNKHYYSLLETKIERWFEEFFSLPDSIEPIGFDYEDIELEDSKYFNDIQIEESIELLEQYVQNENVDTSELMKNDDIHDLPLNIMNDFQTDSLVKLNLFGIYTIKELTNSNISQVSSFTGISQGELKKMKKHANRYGS